jgi:hypothetical protein
MSRISPRVRIAVAALVVAADLMLLWPRPAAADAPTATGSWRIARQSTPVGEIPSSPLTVDGTLPVQNGPAGVLAFSALRYQLSGAAGGTLRLAFAGQAPAVVPSVLACRVTGQWSSGGDQTWEKRPAYDCAQHAVSSGDGAQLSWDLAPGLASSDLLDIALVPDPADPTPFAVSFEPPTPGAFAPSGDTALADGSVTPGGGDTGPLAAPPSGSMAAVPSAPVGGAPAAAAPVVAGPAAAAGGPSYTAQPVAATTVPRSRTVGAGALAAFATILLLRSFLFGGARSRTPRSLLTLPREGA